MSKRKLTKFGVEVKKKLVEKQMTQTELAKKLGTSTKYISSIMYTKYPLVRSRITKKILDELDLDKNLLL